MNGYVPTSWYTLALVGMIAGVELLLSGILHRRPAWGWYRLLAWILAIAATVTAERLCSNEPAGIRMIAIIVTLLLGMKIIIGVEVRLDEQPPLTWTQWLCFALWPGMRPGIFTALGTRVLSDAADLFYRGLVRLALGAGCIAAAWMIWHQGRGTFPEEVARVIATVLLMLGISLAVHFGVFNLMAAGLRRMGVDARPLFRAPLVSGSLTEFWSRRWNLAFSEMTAIAFYRPVASTLGRNAALLSGFIASGVLHELAISVPVMAGFGLPFAYFILHGVLIRVEMSFQARKRGVETWGMWKHVWVIGWLVVPMPILFHLPFLRGCVWPLIGME